MEGKEMKKLFAVRFPEALLKEVSELAERQHRSTTSQIIFMIETVLRSEQKQSDSVLSAESKTCAVPRQSFPALPSDQQGD